MKEEVEFYLHAFNISKVEKEVFIQRIKDLTDVEAISEEACSIIVGILENDTF